MLIHGLVSKSNGVSVMEGEKNVLRGQGNYFHGKTCILVNSNLIGKGTGYNQKKKASMGVSFEKNAFQSHRPDIHKSAVNTGQRLPAQGTAADTVAGSRGYRNTRANT